MRTRVAGVPIVFGRGRSPRSTGRRARRARLGCVAVAALLGVLSTAVVSLSVSAQQGDDSVRIVARKLSSGRVEFGLQQHRSDDTWSSTRLPAQRFFPPTAGIGRWLRSSPLTVRVAATGSTSASAVVVRIVARKLADGRVEFALQSRHSDDSWSDRLLPRVRFFPTGARVGRWLRSSPISVIGTRPAGASDFAAVSAGLGHSCGLRTSGAVTCWGPRQLRPGGRSRRDIPRGGRWWTPFLWPAHRGIDRLLGRQRRRAEVRTGRDVQRCDCWSGTFVRDPHQRRRHVLGPRQLRPRRTHPKGNFRAVAAGGFHSCGLSTSGAITCWGANEDGQTDAPEGNFRAVAAGGFHSCGLSTSGDNHLLGSQRRRPDRRTRREFPRYHRWCEAFMRAAHHRHCHVLGPRHIRAGLCPRWSLRRHHRRQISFVCTASQRQDRLLGKQPKRADRRPRYVTVEGRYDRDSAARAWLVDVWGTSASGARPCGRHTKF